jgi:hypothetical protein
MEALPFQKQKKQHAVNDHILVVADCQVLIGAKFMGSYSLRQCATEQRWNYSHHPVRGPASPLSGFHTPIAHGTAIMSCDGHSAAEIPFQW